MNIKFNFSIQELLAKARGILQPHKGDGELTTGLDWLALLGATVLLLVFLGAYGFLVFFSAQKVINEEAAAHLPATALTIDRTHLSHVLEQMNLANAAFNQLKVTPPNTPDPSR